jgi:hypothetical protein
MALVLDHYFCHRPRTLEKKDGDPLNEVRVLCNSLMSNDGIMVADKTIMFPNSALRSKLFERLMVLLWGPAPRR